MKIAICDDEKKLSYSLEEMICRFMNMQQCSGKMERCLHQGFLDLIQKGSVYCHDRYEMFTIRVMFPVLLFACAVFYIFCKIGEAPPTGKMSVEMDPDIGMHKTAPGKLISQSFEWKEDTLAGISLMLASEEDGELPVKIPEFIFPVFRWREILRQFFQIALIVIAVVIDVFMDAEVLAVFDGLECMSADLAFKLAASAGVVVNILMGVRRKEGIRYQWEPYAACLSVA